MGEETVRSAIKKNKLYLLTLLLVFFSGYCASITKPPGEKPFPGQSFPIKIRYSQSQIKLNIQVKNTNTFYKDLKFIIDTGSNISLLNGKFFKNSGNYKKIKMKSFHSEAEKYVSREEIILRNDEGEAIGENTFYVYDFGPELDCDGILGNDLLSSYTIYLNIPERITFGSISEQQNFSFNEFFKIPILFEDGHVLLHTKMNDKMSYLLFDTGAGISYMNSELVKTNSLKRARKIQVLDLSGKKEESYSYEIENLCVEEKICQKNIELLSGDFLKSFSSPVRPQIDGILGMNWMERFILIVDYKNKALYLKRKESEILP